MNEWPRSWGLPLFVLPFYQWNDTLRAYSQKEKKLLLSEVIVCEKSMQVRWTIGVATIIWTASIGKCEQIQIDSLLIDIAYSVQFLFIEKPDRLLLLAHHMHLFFFFWETSSYVFLPTSWVVQGLSTIRQFSKLSRFCSGVGATISILSFHLFSVHIHFFHHLMFTFCYC